MVVFNNNGEKKNIYIYIYISDERYIPEVEMKTIYIYKNLMSCRTSLF